MGVTQAIAARIAQGYAWLANNGRPAQAPLGGSLLYTDRKTGRIRAFNARLGDRSIESSGGGSGDVTGPSSSVASEVALFDGTTGKLLKRAAGNGLAYLTDGVLSLVTTATPADLSASQRLWGRNSSGSGAAEEVTAAQVIAWIGPKRSQAVGADPLTGAIGAVPVYSPPMRLVVPDGASFRAIGCSFSVDGIATDTSDSTGQWLQLANSLTNVYSIRFGVGKFSTPFVAEVVMRTPATLNGRMWFGVYASLPGGNTDNVPNNSTWIAYRSGVDASNWGLVSRDGTTTSSQTTIAAIATSTAYRLRLRYDGSAMYGSVNGGTEQTVSTNLPAAGTSISLAMAIAPNGSSHAEEIAYMFFRPAHPGV